MLDKRIGIYKHIGENEDAVLNIKVWKEQIPINPSSAADELNHGLLPGPNRKAKRPKKLLAQAHVFRKTALQMQSPLTFFIFHIRCVHILSSNSFFFQNHK
jgi:hypothetical protein